MSLIRRPRQYTFLVSLGFLSIPVFALNIWVMQKGPLAKAFTPDKLILVGAQALWAVIAIHWLLKAAWKGLGAFVAMSLVMVGANLYFLFALKNYALAFYALFLLILSGLYAFHLFRNLGEAYYRSGQRWFEGRPELMPRVAVELMSGNVSVPARLSRLGIEGCYAFINTHGDNPGTDLDEVDRVTLKLGDLALECAVELISQSRDGTGKGIRFLINSADQHKDVSDFIDRVRSSGYVA